MTNTAQAEKPTASKAADGREIVLDILLEVLEKGSYSHVVLRQALNKYQYLEKQERAFISRVAEGTLEYLIQIDYIINQCSSTGVQKMKPVIRTILRMSVYQIFHMDRVPDSAVCNEAVKLAAKRRFQGLKGFVNGVLRNIIRKKDTFIWPDDSVRYSIPAWILSMWDECYEEDTKKAIVTSFLEQSRLTVRLNLNQASKAQIMESLQNQGAVFSESPFSESILYLDEINYLEGLKAFTNGWIQVQDMSSVLAGLSAGPKKGDYVIDVCGAPGGKSLHIADLLQGTGMVEVRDLTYQKVSLIEENIERSGFKNMTAKVWDALELCEDSIKKADIVMADLPCSGLGIIGKKPDIRYHMTPLKLKELSKLQKEILSVVHQYVKPGGILVYSTCTINRAENEENAAWFLKQFPFKPVDLSGRFGSWLKSDTLKDGYIQLLPGIHPCDGFFIAAFRRTEA